MKYPYDRFLRFLVSRKVHVNTTLERYGLPRAGDIWIADCRSAIRREGPDALRIYIDSPGTELTFRDGVLDWASKEKIFPLWAMQSEFGGAANLDLEFAFRIFVNTHSRGVLGMLLLSRVTDDDIIAVMNERFDMKLTFEVIGLYREIFWDVANVGRAMWHPFCESLPSDEERNFIVFGLNGPKIADVRDMLNLEISLDQRAILSQIINKSYMRYKAEIESPHPNNAIPWAELTLKAIGTAKQVGGLNSADDGKMLPAERFKGLFSVVPTKSNHPTLAELAGEVGRPEPPKAGAKAGK